MALGLAIKSPEAEAFQQWLKAGETKRLQW
jgi:hypothetical protein